MPVDNGSLPPQNRLLGMFLPIRTDSPLRTTPYMNWALIFINALFFLAQKLVTSKTTGHEWFEPLVFDARRPEVYQFISYGFLHADFWHIGGNMLFLFIFGNNVNDKMGHVGYLAFYLASLVFAAAFFAYWDPTAPAIGASGAVSAVVGAYLVLFPRAHITVLLFFLIIGAYEVPSVYFILFYFVMNLVGLGKASEGVAYSAHVGGTVFGFLICLGLLAIGLLPRDQFDVVALIKQWNRRRQYRDAVSSGWNPYGTPGPPPRGASRGWVHQQAEEEPVDPRQARLQEMRAEIAEAIANHKLPLAAQLYVKLKQADGSQVLARQSQLDVANQLAQDQRFEEAAEAYETFLHHYPKYEQTEQVELMLGIVLNRFLNQPKRAREYLLRATAKLHDENAVRMARAELEKINAAVSDTT